MFARGVYSVTANLSEIFGSRRGAEAQRGYALGEAPPISLAALGGTIENSQMACGTELHLCASAPLREPKWLQGQDFTHG